MKLVTAHFDLELPEVDPEQTKPLTNPQIIANTAVQSILSMTSRHGEPVRAHNVAPGSSGLSAPTLRLVVQTGLRTITIMHMEGSAFSICQQELPDVRREWGGYVTNLGVNTHDDTTPPRLSVHLPSHEKPGFVVEPMHIQVAPAWYLDTLGTFVEEMRQVGLTEAGD